MKKVEGSNKEDEVRKAKGKRKDRQTGKEDYTLEITRTEERD